VLGLLVAARLRPRAAIALGLGIAAGLLHGNVAAVVEREQIARPALYLLGLTGGTGLLAFHVENLVLRVSAFWMQVAVRVLGSWIAAIGLLVTALEAATGRAAG
jgi:hydrogenase/urease accessory protein HupE